MPVSAQWLGCTCICSFYFSSILILFFFLFSAATTAYGGSQARDHTWAVLWLTPQLRHFWILNPLCCSRNSYAFFLIFLSVMGHPRRSDMFPALYRRSLFILSKCKTPNFLSWGFSNCPGGLDGGIRLRKFFSSEEGLSDFRKSVLGSATLLIEVKYTEQFLMFYSLHCSEWKIESKHKDRF